MRSTWAPPSPRPSTRLRVHEQLGAARRGCPRSHRGSSARARRRRRRWSTRRGAPRGRGPAPPTARRGWSTGSGSYTGTRCDGNTASACASIRSRRRGTPGAGRSARIAARTSGSAMRAARSATGRCSMRVVGGAAAERVRRPQPAEQTLPVRADLRDDARAVGVLALHARQPVAPVAAGAAAERERDRDAALARRGREHVDLAVPHGAVGAGGAGHDRAVDRVGRTLAHGADQRGELVGGGEGARDLASVDRLVQLEPVGAHSDGAGVDALGDEVGHAPDVVVGGGFVGRAALAHHVGAHRAVRHLHRDVERAGDAVERVHVLGHRLPVPPDRLAQARRRGCPRRPP